MSANGSVSYLARQDGSRLAVKRLDGEAPGVLFFCGLRSDMASAKALLVEETCRRLGRACVRFDYSGHGLSDGRFEDGTISRWLSDARAVLLDCVDEKPQVFVGSSLGGWIALLLAMEFPDRAAAIIGVSPAVDFTRHVHDELFAQEQRVELARTGKVAVPDCHGGPPFVLTRQLIEDGATHLLLERDSIPVSCPVRLINARQDRDVPWDTGLKLTDRLESRDVHATIIKDGEHQLSRPSDMAVLRNTLTSLLNSV